jgi:formate dehydrogenase iron-sulfur subunit
MTTRIYVPRDSSALALGADALAAAIVAHAQQRGIDIELIRNGSRGLLWLEPLVEVGTPAGRVGYGTCRRPTCPRCSMRTGSTAARIRAASASSTHCRISRASSA